MELEDKFIAFGPDLSRWPVSFRDEVEKRQRDSSVKKLMARRPLKIDYITAEASNNKTNEYLLAIEVKRKNKSFALIGLCFILCLMSFAFGFYLVAFEPELDLEKRYVLYGTILEMIQ